jgi:hypothetical protein
MYCNGLLRNIYIYIYIYVWKLNQTVLEIDFRAVKFLFFPRRDLHPRISVFSFSHTTSWTQDWDYWFNSYTISVWIHRFLPPCFTRHITWNKEVIKFIKIESIVDVVEWSRALDVRRKNNENSSTLTNNDRWEFQIHSRRLYVF